MQSFILPAGSRMRFTATSDVASRHVHRWGVELSGPKDSTDLTAAKLTYGSEIGQGEDQRIESPEQDADRTCQVWSSHKTSKGWEPDVAEITLDTPDNLSIAFRRPEAVVTSDIAEECLMAFRFSPALRS